MTTPASLDLSGESRQVVDPDVKVVDDPAKMVDGGDPQLDAAIDEMLNEIEKNPYQAPKRPAYPDRSKFGVEPADK